MIRGLLQKLSIAAICLVAAQKAATASMPDCMALARAAEGRRRGVHTEIMQHRLAIASRALLRRAKSTAAAPAHEAASAVGIYSDEHMAMRASLRHWDRTASRP